MLAHGSSQPQELRRWYLNSNLIQFAEQQVGDCDTGLSVEQPSGILRPVLFPPVTALGTRSSIGMKTQWNGSNTTTKLRQGTPKKGAHLLTYTLTYRFRLRILDTEQTIAGFFAPFFGVWGQFKLRFTFKGKTQWKRSIFLKLLWGN